MATKNTSTHTVHVVYGIEGNKVYMSMITGFENPKAAAELCASYVKEAQGIDTDRVIVVTFTNNMSINEIERIASSQSWCEAIDAFFTLGDYTGNMAVSYEEFQEAVDEQEAILSNIEGTDVESSMISRVEYGNYDNKLLVYFKSGIPYMYDDVPHEIYEELISAESVGKYFNKNIRGKYDFTRMAA